MYISHILCPWKSAFFQFCKQGAVKTVENLFLFPTVCIPPVAHIKTRLTCASKWHQNKTEVPVHNNQPQHGNHQLPTTSLWHNMLEKPEAVTLCAGCWPFALNVPWRWITCSTVPPLYYDDTPPLAQHNQLEPNKPSKKQPKEDNHRKSTCLHVVWFFSFLKLFWYKWLSSSGLMHHWFVTWIIWK